MGDEAKRNWKTTVFGIGSLLVAVGAALVAVFDGDPETVLDVQATITAVLAALAALGFIVAKDGDK